jgi:hypothetical protein
LVQSVRWLYKRQFYKGLEFIADNKPQKSISDQKSLSVHALKITCEIVLPKVPFYQSLIKKRIVMLNKINQRFLEVHFNSSGISRIVLFQIETIAGKKSEQIITEPSKNR